MTHPSQESEMRTELLTAEEEARARELLARDASSTEFAYSWRSWASDLTWIVPRYAGRLIATLDARVAAAREQAATEARRELLAKVWREFGADAHTIARIERLLEEPR